jgi:tetratricopeptide (TPR) repeat protein
VVDTLTMFYLFLGAAASISQENISFTSIRLPCWIKNIATMIAVIILVVIGSFTLREAKAEWYYKNAIVENSEGKADNAQNSFEQVISEQPYQYEYYQAYGDFAFRIASSSQADLDKEMIANYLKLAIANYQKAIVLNPSHPSTLYNLGLASMQLSLNLQNDFYLQQGMNALKKSIELGVNNPLYPYQAGKIFLQIGRKDLAQEAFEIVMKIKPDYQDIQLLLQKK